MRPTDSSPAGGPGPSAADSVDLATGVLENSPGPDMVVRNPIGPDPVYSRLYRSANAAVGYGSPGLTPGWVDNYDMVLMNAGASSTWSALDLVYPNGAEEKLTPVLANGIPTGVFNRPFGTPYLVTGVPSTVKGKWLSITFKLANESSISFLPDPGNSDRYLLRKLSNMLGQSINVNYDATHGNRLNTITDDAVQRNTLISFNYDLGGHLSYIRDIYGRQVSFTYATAAGTQSLSSVSQTVPSGWPAPILWACGYTSILGRPFLSSVGVPKPTGGSGIQYHPINYDVTSGKVLSLVDANGSKRAYAYSGATTKVTVTDANGVVAQSWTQKIANAAINAGGIDANGASSSLHYNDPINPFQVTDATNENGQSANATYDQFGNVVTTTDSRGLRTQFSHDYSVFPIGRLTSIQVGTKAPVILHYFPNGMLQAVDTPAPGSVDGQKSWVTSSYTYTKLGNVATVSQPAPNGSGGHVITTFNYTFDPLGGYTKTEALGEPVTVTDPLGNVSHFRYDVRGNVLAVIDAEGIRTDYVYNYADQLTQVVYPATGQTGGGRAKTIYNYLYIDGPLSFIQVLDESGAIVRTVTSVMGNEGEQVKEKIGSLTKATVGYDAQYRGGSFADGKTQKSSYSYDNVGNLTSLSYPSGTRLRFSNFDPAGNLLTRIDARGNTTTYTRAHDDSRVTDVNYPDAKQNVHLQHDQYGRLTRMQDWSGIHTYTYDQSDLLLSTTSTFYVRTLSYTAEWLDITDPATAATIAAKTISYTYYPDGSPASMTTPGGTFSYAYDNAGRLTSVLFPWATSAGYTYYKNGYLSTQTNDLIKTTYLYNARGFLTRLTNDPSTPGNPSYSDYSGMTYSALGQRTHVAISIPSIVNGMYTIYPDASGTVDYQYDDNGRLIRETSIRNNDSTYHGTYDNMFVWDAANNPTTLRNIGQSYNIDNQRIGNTFDNDGNQAGFGSFDYENRRTIYGDFLSGYRGDGLRAWKIDEGYFTRNYLLYDGSRVVCEINGDGSTAWVSGYGANGLAQVGYPNSGGTYTYPGLYWDYSFDPQGTIVQRHTHSYAYPTDIFIFDAFGLGIQAYNYNSDGFPRSQEPVGFVGQLGCYSDYSTNLVLMGYRYYYPGTARFITRDPLSYDAGANLYVYCEGDPVNRVDPLGLDGFDNISNFFAGAGDSLTFGLTGLARRGLNRLVNGEWEDPANTNSTAYQVGEWTETTVEVTLTLGSAGLKKLANKKIDKLARKEMEEMVKKNLGTEADNLIKHHTNPLAGHPINLTKGKTVTAVFPTRGLPGFIHSAKKNLKLFPNTVAGKADHMAAHQRLMRLERVFTKVINPRLTVLRASRNAVHDAIIR